MEMIHHHFESIRSTNDWAKKELSTFEREKLTIITADEQLKGRGQYGRQWISPKEENLYASFCFFIDENQQDSLTLTHVFALSLARVLENHSVEGQIKWPNDVLVDGKKIAGILCETEHLPPYFGVVIGVGFNINMSQKALEKVGQPATSLLLETGKQREIAEMRGEVENAFIADLEQFFREGFTPFMPSFKKRMLPNPRFL